MWISQQEWTNGIFVPQLFACCGRAPSLATSLHHSVLHTAEWLSAACCLMLVHLFYAIARLLFDLVFSDSCLQLPHCPCHSCLRNIPDATSAGPCFSSINTSHLHRLWASHPVFQWCKHRDFPSSELSGPRGSTRSQHILELYFWVLKIGRGHREQTVLVQQGRISLSLLFVCTSLSPGNRSEHKRCSKQQECWVHQYFHNIIL